MPPLHQHFFELARDLNCNVFVESGTFRALTYRRAVELEYFERVYSVEISPELYGAASAIYGESERARVFQGKTHEVLLRDIFALCTATDRIFFFLDGHYSGGDTSGGDEPCPLLLELAAIRDACPTQSVVIAIDDTDDFGKRSAVSSGDVWPSREDVEAAIGLFQQDFCGLDFTGIGGQKAYRGMLIYAYREPSATWKNTPFEAVFVEAQRRRNSAFQSLKRALIQIWQSRMAHRVARASHIPLKDERN